MPARSCNMSRVELYIESLASISGEPEGEGDADGIDCATVRKKSSMYCSEFGSYYDRLN